MDIGTVIKDIRMKNLLSQNDFAQAIGVSFSTVNRWENGKAMPNYKALKSLKQFCHDSDLDFNIDVEQCFSTAKNK